MAVRGFTEQLDSAYPESVFHTFPLPRKIYRQIWNCNYLVHQELSVPNSKYTRVKIDRPALWSQRAVLEDVPCVKDRPHKPFGRWARICWMSGSGGGGVNRRLIYKSNKLARLKWRRITYVRADNKLFQLARKNYSARRQEQFDLISRSPIRQHEGV